MPKKTPPRTTLAKLMANQNPPVVLCLMAKKTGLTRQTLGRLRNGQQMPTKRTAAAIARFFKLPASAIFDNIVPYGR